MCPNQGPNLQPGYMPWLRIEPPTFWSTGWCSNQLNHTGQGSQILFLQRFYFIFRQRGREEERERNISVWLPLTLPLLGTWPTTQACALTGNQTCDLLVCRLVLNPLSHTSQGSHILFSAQILCVFFWHQYLNCWSSFSATKSCLSFSFFSFINLIFSFILSFLSSIVSSFDCISVKYLFSSDAKSSRSLKQNDKQKTVMPHVPFY